MKKFYLLICALICFSFVSADPPIEDKQEVNKKELVQKELQSQSVAETTLKIQDKINLKQSKSNALNVLKLSTKTYRSEINFIRYKKQFVFNYVNEIFKPGENILKLDRFIL